MILDLKYVAIINRYKDNENYTLGVVRNFGIKKGTIASTVAHDCHNLIIVYSKPEEAILAAKELINVGGGIICIENEIVLANEVSKIIFGFGAVTLKVDIQDDLVTIRSKHRKAKRSEAMEREVPSLKAEVDFQLSKVFKTMLKEKLQEDMDLRIEAILRDYDSTTQWAFTNIILAGPQNPA